MFVAAAAADGYRRSAVRRKYFESSQLYSHHNFGVTGSISVHLLLIKFVTHFYILSILLFSE